MPHGSAFRPDDPRAWLEMAREDFALASARFDGVTYRPLCYHAQQTAEKAIKTVLIARFVWFPYVDDLGPLLDLCRDSGLDVPEGWPMLTYSLIMLPRSATRALMRLRTRTTGPHWQQPKK